MTTDEQAATPQALTVAKLREFLSYCDPAAIIVLRGTGVAVEAREEGVAPSAGQYLATVYLIGAKQATAPAARLPSAERPL